MAFYIRKADCILICAGMYCAHREWIQAEMDIANAFGKPIIGVELWAQQRTPVEVQSAAATMVGWSTESIVRAVRAICPDIVPRLVHISFTVSPAVSQWTIDAAVREVSLDWCRYAWNCFIFWTMLDGQTIVGSDQGRSRIGIGICDRSRYSRRRWVCVFASVSMAVAFGQGLIRRALPLSALCKIPQSTVYTPDVV